MNSPDTLTSQAGSASCKTMSGTPEQMGKALADLAKAGDQVGSYRLLNRLPPREASEVMLRAGFTVVDFRKPSSFWNYATKQISQACRLRVDGYGLRAVTL